MISFWRLAISKDIGVCNKYEREELSRFAGLAKSYGFGRGGLYSG